MKREIPYRSDGDDQEQGNDDGNRLPAFHITVAEHVVSHLKRVDKDDIVEARRLTDKVLLTGTG